MSVQPSKGPSTLQAWLLLWLTMLPLSVLGLLRAIGLVVLSFPPWAVSEVVTQPCQCLVTKGQDFEEPVGYAFDMVASQWCWFVFVKPTSEAIELRFAHNILQH